MCHQPNICLASLPLFQLQLPARLSLWLQTAETKEVTSNRETMEWGMDALEGGYCLLSPTAAKLSLTLAG